MSNGSHSCAKCGHVNQIPDKAQSTITVRMPKVLQEQLKRAAHERETSLNLLCCELLSQLAASPPATELSPCP